MTATNTLPAWFTATATAPNAAELTAAIAHLTPLAAAAHLAFDEARTAFGATPTYVYGYAELRSNVEYLRMRSQQLNGALHDAQRMLAEVK